MRRMWCGQNTVPATLQTAPHPYYGGMSMTTLEATMVSEAEAALDLIKHGDDEEGHHTYHEITTYAKLCMLADCGMSEATWRKIDEIHKQAVDIGRARGEDEDDPASDKSAIKLG
jgi:hypothetical protein